MDQLQAKCVEYESLLARLGSNLDPANILCDLLKKKLMDLSARLLFVSQPTHCPHSFRQPLQLH